MNKIRYVILCLCLLGLGVFLFGPRIANSNIEVKDAYVRGLPASVQNTSAYMTIINNSDDDLILTGASADEVAASAMLHETEMINGMMSMTHLMGLTIASHSEVELKPSGIHLMLMGLKQPLEVGDQVVINLLFQGGSELAVTMPVRSVLNENQ